MTTKRVPILPTLVTLGNAFCGFTAIDYAMKAGASGACSRSRTSLKARSAATLLMNQDLGRAVSAQVA